MQWIFWACMLVYLQKSYLQKLRTCKNMWIILKLWHTMAACRGKILWKFTEKLACFLVCSTVNFKYSAITLIFFSWWNCQIDLYMHWQLRILYFHSNTPLEHTVLYWSRVCSISLLLYAMRHPLQASNFVFTVMLNKDQCAFLF